jgi:hypothetical protein
VQCFSAPLLIARRPGGLYKTGVNMTAEIAILNQSGVALAADSAVTIGLNNNDRKIYNTANKLFMLSKFRPIGIMIYSNAKFMGLEWELIIKEYRKKLGNKKFDKLVDYYHDFISFIETTTIFSDDLKENELNKHILGTLSMIQSKIEKSWKEEINKKECIDDDEAIKIINDTIDSIILGTKNDLLLKIDEKSFIEKYDSKLNENIDSQFREITEEIKNKLKVLIYHNIASLTYYKNYSGIVIAGYGDNEIFPSIISLLCKTIIPDAFVFQKDIEQSISREVNATIVPFAQSDMVKVFIDGIDPFFESFLSKELKIIWDSIRSIFPLAKEQTDSLEGKLNESLNEYKQKTFVNPILNIVGSLPKIDLAEMAESLVNLTAFKRHVSTDAETVGGPTDVALISKGDGFIWVKRKHYFDPKLNQHFFQNYYKED